ncbi:MAG: ribonuclease H-like YkuK family protein [Candidatus Parcubacteria bacterium]|nr:ribonuclease H-like YkuK family protein [Candidatus Parcubacteria bacterium]
MSDKTQFYNETLKKHIKFEEVVDELLKYIKSEPEAQYKITVGTDSDGVNNAQFVTAIAILRVGNGGRYFWTKTEKTFCPTLRDRIFKETMHSIAAVQELRDRLRGKMGEESFWNDKITVHLDVGKNGPTREFVESVVGMVRGFGFETAIKPDSFGAFVLADRHT